jgi:NADPH2:quinone reductase
MRAALCTRFGTPDVIELGEVSTPEPGPGEVLVRVRAAGVNYADLVVIAGKYQIRTEPPFVPGMEIAGAIAGIGSDVTGWTEGDRAVALIDAGGYAEYVAVRADRLFRIPDAMAFTTAAGTFINYGTVHAALHWRARLQPGETCLVLGGAGGVGLAAIATASEMGAKVIGAASSAERCAIMARQGATDTIDYGSTSLRERVQELTGKRGANVIIDPVGGEMGGLALRCIGWSGRIVSLGFPAGSPPSYPANILLVKNAAALGMFFSSYFEHALDPLRDAVASMQAALSDGRMRTYPIETRPLDALPQLLSAMQERRSTGKAVVTL